MDSVICTDNGKINIMTGNGKKAVRTFFLKCVIIWLPPPILLQMRGACMEPILRAAYGLLFDIPLGLFMLFTIILGIIKRFTS